MRNPTVYILTVTHNRRSTTAAFCESLQAQTYRNFVLILVDDGSCDGTPELVSEFPFRKEICHGDGRLWWAGGLRRGSARLRAITPDARDIVLIANDDTAFKPDFLEKAVVEMEGVESGAMMCVPATFVDRGIQALGCCVCVWQRLTFRDFGRHPERIDCASTRCLMSRFSDFSRAGSFRPGLLPHYLSDYAFTIRAQRRGIRFRPAKSVSCLATGNTTGTHELKLGSFRQVVAQMLSPRFSANPLSLFMFVLLSAPVIWKPVCWLMALRTSFSFFFRAAILERLRNDRKRP